MSQPILIYIVGIRILIQQAVADAINHCSTLPMKSIPCAVNSQKNSKIFARVIDLYHLTAQQITFWAHDAMASEAIQKVVTIAIKPDRVSAPQNNRTSRKISRFMAWFNS